HPAGPRGHVAAARYQAALMALRARASAPECLGARAPAEADDHLVHREAFLASLALEPDREIRARGVEPDDARTRLHLDPALRERADNRLCDLLVDAAEHLRQHLEDRDLGADVDEERRELAPDRAAADHRDPAGHFGELEHIVGGEDAFAVELETGDRERAR